MEDLPPFLLIDILNRLSDSADLARCRLVSKTLNAMSYEVWSLNHLCTSSRYRKYRSQNYNPFKSAFNNLLRNSRRLESISIGVERSLGRRSYDEVEDDGDDLYLTDVRFLEEWIPVIGGGLRSLSISDFWSQSSWRRSEALVLISSYCYDLLDLEVKNAWLSVDGLKLMPKLTTLTLEYIRLDDENLNKVCHCFLGLQVLNLIGVGGLKDPNIDLKYLKICHWTVSNAPTSLTILAPNLVQLKLESIRPRSLVLETPSLSDLRLTFEKAYEFKVKDIPSLTSLQLAACDLCRVMGVFRSSKAVKVLGVDIPKCSEPVTPILSLDILFNYFPNVSSLELGAGAWSAGARSETKPWSVPEGFEGKVQMNGLKEVTAHLVFDEIETSLSFISYILDRCTNLTGMSLLIHEEVDSSLASKFISKCRANWPRIRWRWGIRTEGRQDIWLSDASSFVDCKGLKHEEN